MTSTASSNCPILVESIRYRILGLILKQTIMEKKIRLDTLKQIILINDLG